MDTEECDVCGYLHDKEEDDNCPTCELISTIKDLENKLDGFLDRHLTIVEKLLELNKEVKE